MILVGVGGRVQGKGVGWGGVSIRSNILNSWASLARLFQKLKTIFKRLLLKVDARNTRWFENELSQ